MAELWVIDRSDPYSCEKFDLHKDSKRFIRVIAGYTLMSDEELGMNPYIKEDKNGKYIMPKEENKTEETKLYLEDRPIAVPRAIVCRGTTCYRAKTQEANRWEYVVKFAWRSDQRHAEGDLLTLAKQRKVWGVVRLFSHQDLKSIAELRQDMEFGSPRTFRPPPRFRSAVGDIWSKSQSGTSGSSSGPGISKHPLSSPSTALSSPSTVLSSPSSGQKRKRQADVSTAPVKRSKSENSRRRVDITSLIKAGDDKPEEADRYRVEQPKRTSLGGLAGPEDGSFDNRVFSCLVISPPGRPIHEFESIKEFLEACRDILKAHRSLYLDGHILHRDISTNNLIITDNEEERAPKGMLIDLDLAKEVGSGGSGARHRTGTREFMAIEVLEGKAHTYRHDLESFFYVFLWVIIRHNLQYSPWESQLRPWYTGSYRQIADMKRSHMDKLRFVTFLDEFPSKFNGLKGLAEELRDVLFPCRNGLITGTYSDHDLFYMPMIAAFEKAILQCTDD